MSTKAHRRASYEERVDQDGRLTGKHIRTLLHLQDLHTENDLLKARIAELELEEAKAARCDLLEREVEKLQAGSKSNCGNNDKGDIKELRTPQHCQEIKKSTKYFTK